MDLREIKTKRNIKNAFFTLRKQKPLEKISVKELAGLAEISKATFYLHYHDIYDLSNTLQQEVIQNVLNSLSEPERILTDEIAFTRDLFHAFMTHQASIDILFSGSQASVLPSSIEKELRAYIFRQFPKAKEDAALNILLTYKIQGGYYAFQNNQHKYDIDFILNAISNCLTSQTPQA